MNTQRQTLSFEQKALPSGLTGFERFELALQAESQLGNTIARLNETEAELAQLSASHQYEIEKALTLQEELDDARQEAVTLDGLLELIQKTVIDQKNRIDEQNEIILKSNNIITGIRLTCERQANALNITQAELKKLRALNPEKLKNQVKRIKEKNSELLTTNKQAVAEKNAFQKASVKLAIEKEQLIQENKAIYLALDKAAKEANGILQRTPIETFGDFHIYSDADDHEVVHIEDTKTGISIPFREPAGIPRKRPIPKEVLDGCAQRIISNRKTMKRLAKYDA